MNGKHTQFVWVDLETEQPIWPGHSVSVDLLWASRQATTTLISFFNFYTHCLALFRKSFDFKTVERIKKTHYSFSVGIENRKDYAKNSI